MKDMCFLEEKPLWSQADNFTHPPTANPGRVVKFWIEASYDSG